MKKARTVIYMDKNDQVVVEYQNLSERPSGNAAQRAKALRSGWQPQWIKAEKRLGVDVFAMGLASTTEEGEAIRDENEKVAQTYRELAASTVDQIDTWNGNFEIPEFVPTPVIPLGQLWCWSCEEMYAVTTHEGHPLCDECMTHFSKKSVPTSEEVN